MRWRITNMSLGRRKKITCGGAAAEISKCPDVQMSFAAFAAVTHLKS
jgi:hypothetical protein